MEGDAKIYCHMDTPITSPRPLTVLVVDRDPEERDVICHIVGEKYPVLIASDSLEALKVARISHPDIIVLSVAPHPTPRETNQLGDLLQDHALANTPVLILGTADGRERDAVLSLSTADSPQRHASVTLRNKWEGVGQMQDELHRIIGARRPLHRSSMTRRQRMASATARQRHNSAALRRLRTTPDRHSPITLRQPLTLAVANA